MLPAPPDTLLLYTWDRNRPFSFQYTEPAVFAPGEYIVTIAEIEVDVSTDPPFAEQWSADAGILQGQPVVSGGVWTTSVGTAGTGYVAGSPPPVTADPPPLGGTQALLHAVVNGSGAVTDLIVDDPGLGYLDPPALTIAPPTSGTQATGSCTLRMDTVTLFLASDDNPPVYRSWYRLRRAVNTNEQEQLMADDQLVFVPQ